MTCTRVMACEYCKWYF